MVDFKDLDNVNSDIYLNTLNNQILYIDYRMSKINNRYLNNKMKCVGEIDEIADHLNFGAAPNVTQQFFNTDKYKKNRQCIVCEGLKGETSNIRQLERAHCRTHCRKDLLIKAIKKLWINNKTPIETGKILKLFIEMHKECPIYLLCNKCHTIYDNPKNKILFMDSQGIEP